MNLGRVVLAGGVLLVALGAISLRTCAANPPHAVPAEPPSAAPPAAAEPTAASRRPRPTRAEAEEPAVEAPQPAETGSIAGVALRTDGRPAAGAKVRAAPGGDQTKGVVAQAGEDGTFRFPALAPGRWTVACAGGGFGTRVDRGVEAPAVDVVAGAEVRVEVRGEPLAVVAGHVTGPDGKPVANVRVQAQCNAFLYREGAWRLDAKTGDDGAYEFANVTPGDFVWLFFTADGFATEDRRLRDVQSASRTVVDVALVRAVPLELLLAAADDGAPVTNAIVWITDAETGFLYDGGHGDSFEPDAAGRVLATMLRPRPVRVQIDAKGFVSVPHTTVDPVAQQGPLTFRLVRAKTIAGRLLHSNGTPAPGEWVRAVSAVDKSRFPDDACSGRSGDDGAFRIEGLLAGRYRVGVWSSTGDEIVVGEAEAGAADVVLTIAGEAKVRRVRVRITGPEGQPVAEARIRDGATAGGELCSSAGGVPVKAERDVELPPVADAFVEAWDARDASGARLPFGHVLTIVPTDATDGFTVTLPPERTIAGRVVGTDGEPVEGATIAVVTVPRGGFGEGMSEELVGTTSAARGAFLVGGLGDDRVRLTASADGFVGAPVEADAGASDVTLRLAPEASAAIRVVDPDGKPVAEAGVMAARARDGAADARGEPVCTVTDADGRARLRGLAPGGRYRLVVSVPGPRPRLFPFEDRDWAPADAEIRLARAYVLEGAVRGATAEALAEGDLVIEASRNGARVESDLLFAEGTFRMLVREPGRYMLSVVLRGDSKTVLASAEAEADGTPATIEIRAK
jgi:protocatechuate 3,4-dioxygenase beta subunit